jgi:hypothetical protein
MANILIGGDIAIVGRAPLLFSEGNAEEIFGNILPYFRDTDLNAVNLECALMMNGAEPIAKDGPALGAPVECIKGISNSRIKLLNLANNHSFDYGAEGLRTTIESCNRAGIGYFGAGMNIQEAREILVREVKGIRTGFLGMAEHEFSLATKTRAGANPLDIIDFVRIVAPRRKELDFLIVLLHGGKEHYPYPSPQLMKTCRFLVEQGASAVICQHSHCSGCYEVYKGAPIVYGQGNLVFDLGGRPDHWHQGFLVQLELGNNGQCAMKMIPYRQFGERAGLREMQGEERSKFLAAMAHRSEQILNADFVHENWLKHCCGEKYNYFSLLYGYNRLMRVLNRKLHYSDWLYTRKKKLMVRNVVECETHREVLETLWRDENA